MADSVPDALAEQFELKESLVPRVNYARHEVRAVDRRDGREVRITFYGPAGYSAEAELRFELDWFRVISQFRHPSFIGWLGWGCAGHVYLTTEWFDGAPLYSAGTRAPFPKEEVLRIIRPVAAALEALHAIGVVHRHVSPDEIRLAEREVKLAISYVDPLIDAINRWREEMRFRAGQILPPVAYVAPEILLSKWPLSYAADLFSLGVVAYELLSGGLPWDGASHVEQMVAMLRDPPRRIVRAHPKVKNVAAVERVLGRALDKDAKERHESIAVFMVELERALEEPAPK